MQSLVQLVFVAMDRMALMHMLPRLMQMLIVRQGSSIVAVTQCCTHLSRVAWFPER